LDRLRQSTELNQETVPEGYDCRHPIFDYRPQETGKDDRENSDQPQSPEL
jgi:hypothetical protein